MAIHHNGNRASAPSGVRLEDNRLHVNNVSFESAAAAGVLRRFPPDEWVGVVGRMVDHGAGALEAAYTSSTLQLVTQQLQAQMSEVFDKAGQTLFARVATAFEDGDESALGRYLAKFSREVQTGFATLAAQQAVKHHTESATALGGVVYEEAVLATIAEIVRTCGDIPEHCAATLGQVRRRHGDIVIGINQEVCRGASLRIVCELKRRAEGSQPFSVAAIRSSLKLARENRSAQAGIFLVEDPRLLPTVGSGFVEFGSGDYATVYTPGGSTLGLAVAYRLARLAVVARALGRGGEEAIDLDAAQRAVTDIRKTMSRVEQIRSQHAAAIGAINRAGTGVQDLVDAVLLELHHLDDILRG